MHDKKNEGFYWLYLFISYRFSSKIFKSTPVHSLDFLTGESTVWRFYTCFQSCENAISRFANAKFAKSNAHSEDVRRCYAEYIYIKIEKIKFSLILYHPILWDFGSVLLLE